MTHSYNKKYREGVIFLFYRKGDILIEHRPTEEGKEVFIPNGSIEEKDHNQGIDYRIVAMHREIEEEFDGKIKAKEFRKLSEFKVPKVKLHFYTYLITKWEGQFPEYTVEEGEKFSDLEWVSLKDYGKYLKFESAIDACKKLQKYLKDLKKCDF
jgi:8-oxo-dGTP pyrophosphatase MutT (NUDIX family)